jgi:rhamnulokinase
VTSPSTTGPVTFVAVDFGASSMRVCRVELGDGPPVLEVVHRVTHGPARDANGTLRWEWERLLAEVDRGLDLACAAGPVASIGVDTWAIDYGLVDAHGALLAPPVSYRDDRTANFREVVDRIGEERLYAISGLQMLPFNTIFQLAAEDRDLLTRADRLVMLPELVVAHLTGIITCEMTSAGCTGLLDLATGDWSDELCDAIDLPRALLPDILEAGTRVGKWRSIPVHLVGGHDTASAVLGGGARGEAFVSAGTWLLVGREQPEPDTSDAARLAGFTNEQAAFGGIRLLRNVAGWWLVEECRRAWGDSDLDTLLARAAALPVPERLVDATDDRFLAPADMATELCAAAGLRTDATPAEITRVAVESMAASTARVVATMPGDQPLGGIRVFGGGARAQLYLDALRRHATLPVTTGPVEATAIGNALAQGIALGWYADADAARAMLTPEVNP